MTILTLILGLFTGFLDFFKGIWSAIRYFKEWWNVKRPATRILGPILNNKIQTKIFIKDLICPNNTIDDPKLVSIEGSYHQYNPNIEKVWPEVEARGIAELLNFLGELGKRDKLEIVEMSRGYDQWGTDMIVLGAQAVKCLEFYQVMEKVGYRMDERSIYDNESNEPIEMDAQHGYGLIIKAENQLPNGKKGVAILLGGFGVLGTEAAIYYFRKNISQLGKEFGNKCFSIVLKARINSGRESARRVPGLVKVFD